MKLTTTSNSLERRAPTICIFWNCYLLRANCRKRMHEYVCILGQRVIAIRRSVNTSCYYFTLPLANLDSTARLWYRADTPSTPGESPYSRTYLISRVWHEAWLQLIVGRFATWFELSVRSGSLLFWNLFVFVSFNWTLYQVSMSVFVKRWAGSWFWVACCIRYQ